MEHEEATQLDEATKKFYGRNVEEQILHKFTDFMKLTEDRGIIKIDELSEDQLEFLEYIFTEGYKDGSMHIINIMKSLTGE